MARRYSKRNEGGRRRRRTMRGGTMVTTPLGAGQQNIVGTLLVEGGNVSGPVPGYPATTDGGNPQPFYSGSYAAAGGRRRRNTKKVVKKKSVKAIRRLLKAKGLKVSGSRRAVTARARKARIPMKGGKQISGAPYQSYQGGDGNADRGLASQFSRDHPVYNDVQNIPGYGPGSTEFISSGSGGLVPA